MTALINSENFVFFLQFVVPGFIILYLRSRFITGRLPPIAESLATCAILSTLYQALLVSLSGFLPEEFADSSIYWIVFIFIVPAIIGLIAGIIVQNDTMLKLVRKYRLNPVHPVATAWDWYFGRTNEKWVLVTLKDGKVWRGFLSDESFMSSDPKERDILISMVYTKADDDSPWDRENSSVWIAHSEIQSIEFIPITKEEKNVKQTK